MNTRVLSVHFGADTAGIGYGLAQAFKNHPTITLDSTVRRINYINYPTHTPWDQTQSLWNNANVAHLHNSAKAWHRLGADKPFVLHHHGTQYRNHHELYNTFINEHNAQAVIATLDLHDYGDNLTWIPQPHQLEQLATYRKPMNGPLRIGHAPTNRSIKDTDTFLTACQKLDVQPVLIEGQTWRDCLTGKGTCDIYYDQMQLGYGSNAIEAWAMGIPVIAGATPTTLERMRQTFGQLPFLEATRNTLTDAIEQLTREDTRDHYAQRGQQHAHRWHNGHETTKRLTPIYQQLAA